VSAITVSDLHKSYGAYEAVRGIDFEIEAGEVFGLLGPNGAGKTTTVEILEGYRTRDGGQVTVLGEDPAHAGLDWRERIGVVLQSGALYQNLTVTEHLELFAGYYQQPRDVGKVIELVGLTEKRDARVRTLSGGQQRRLDLGLGLIGDPEVLFLDEPTTGFDPAARRAAWDVIRTLMELGKTHLIIRKRSSFGARPTCESCRQSSNELTDMRRASCPRGHVPGQAPAPALLPALQELRGLRTSR